MPAQKNLRVQWEVDLLAVQMLGPKKLERWQGQLNLVVRLEVERLVLS